MLSFEEADVFILAPVWVSYGSQAKLAGYNIIKLPTSFEQRWRVTAETLKTASQQKLHQPSILIFNFPGNPDRLTYSENELKKIVAEARA